MVTVRVMAVSVKTLRGMWSASRIPKGRVEIFGVVTVRVPVTSRVTRRLAKSHQFGRGIVDVGTRCHGCGVVAIQ